MDHRAVSRVIDRFGFLRSLSELVFHRTAPSPETARFDGLDEIDEDLECGIASALRRSWYHR